MSSVDVSRYFNIVVAYSVPERGIGLHGKLPWSIYMDLDNFQVLTKGTKDPRKKNALIMGRITAKSILKRRKKTNSLLPDRISIVLSTNQNNDDDASPFSNIKDTIFMNSLDKALEYAWGCEDIDRVFVIGGSKVYLEALRHPSCRTIYATEIYYSPNITGFDTYFPDLSFSRFKMIRMGGKIRDKNGNVFGFMEYCPIRTPEDDYPAEFRYLNLLTDLLSRGEVKETRNGKVKSLFGTQLVFDIQKDGFPLLTTKKMFWKGIALELMDMFLKGNTNGLDLAKKGVQIWVDNSTKEVQDKMGLGHYIEGDCGPIYGFQWRHWNAPYKGCEASYKGCGIDQLSEVIRLLEEDPDNRRIFMTSWNPEQLGQMVLPPCHVSYQFSVRNGRELWCHMYQRSADVFLGLPFNIASTALLTCLIANTVNGRDLIPGKVIISLGDYHLYEEHWDSAREQLSRIPYEFPTLKVKNKKNIDEYSIEDLELVNYMYHPPIKALMKV